MDKQTALERLRRAGLDFILACQGGDADLAEMEYLEAEATRTARSALRAGCSVSEVFDAQILEAI